MNTQNPGPDLFSQIRNACSWVAESAQHVRIREEKVDALLALLPLDRAKTPPLDPRCHYLEKGKDTVAFFLTLETINFGSGFFPYLEEGASHSGYFLIAGALAEHFRQRGPIPAGELARLTARDCAALFHQTGKSGPVQDLMTLFARALNQLGEYLIAKFDGQFDQLLNAAAHSAERLARLLLEMPCFQDIALYKGRKVPFLKRAQITAADLSVAFREQGAGYFSDLDQLTSFADNMIPHVLRCEGLLAYSPPLAAKIDAGQLLESGSGEEVEIRACALHAVELLRRRLAEQGRPLRSMDLDYLIWNRGLEADRTEDKAIHLTRTWFY